MRTFLSLLVATSLMVACSPVPHGGEGATQTGETLIAEAKLGFDGTNTVDIVSAAGWSCAGTYSTNDSVGSATRAFPLTCSKGASGNAIMSVNSVQQRATVAFNLDNGVSGKVAFGVVS